MEEGSRSSPPTDWSLPAFTDPMPSCSGRRRSSLPFLNLTLLIIILPALALLLIIFALSPVLSFSFQILKPNSVKKGGDSLIMLVVIFAGFCAIFNRRNDEEPPSRQSSGSSHSEFFNLSDHKMLYNSAPNTRLRRRTSSYPDLRQLDVSSETAVDHRYKFFDDFELSRYRSSSPVLNVTNNIAKPEEERIIPEYTFTLHRNIPPSSPPPQSITPPPSQPPTPPAPPPRQARTYQTIPRKDKSPSAEVAPPAPAPPPPPPPPAPKQNPPKTVEMKSVKLERKKSSVKKELRLVLSSIYNQRKRKKTQKRSKSISVTSNLSTDYNTSSSRLFPPPSPPPPPPPPSVFHNLFKRVNNESKRIHSVPPPPPPPPLRQPSGGRPPLLKRVNKNYSVKEEIIINSGRQSPLTPPPPPPPLPYTRYPFSGVVNLRSEQNSRCSSPELDVGDEMSIKKLLEADGGDESKIGSVFCPSPDVNIKADTFIAKLRSEWRLEKINSLRAKQKFGP